MAGETPRPSSREKTKKREIEQTYKRESRRLFLDLGDEPGQRTNLLRKNAINNKNVGRRRQENNGISPRRQLERIIAGKLSIKCAQRDGHAQKESIYCIYV